MSFLDSIKGSFSGDTFRTVAAQAAGAYLPPGAAAYASNLLAPTPAPTQVQPAPTPAIQVVNVPAPDQEKSGSWFAANKRLVAVGGAVVAVLVGVLYFFKKR